MTAISDSVSARIADEEWEYPPVRLPDGTELSSAQVEAVLTWYWKSGQAREDVEGAR